jgi:hypothetical protein
MRYKIVTFAVLMVLILGTIGFSFWAGLDMGRHQPPVIVTEYIDRPVVQKVEVIKEVFIEVSVDRIVKIYPAGKQFENETAFKSRMDEYHCGITVLGGNCVDLALVYVELARKEGYLVSTEVTSSGTHMVVSTLTIGDEFWLYDPETGRCWKEWAR